MKVEKEVCNIKDTMIVAQNHRCHNPNLGLETKARAYKGER
jgi:hypothetical protein